MTQEEFLLHYGVKGMRWGVRRYQDKGGSLNPAGKERYKAKGSDSKVTKRVKKDLAEMSPKEFKQKYQVSNARYMKRVDKYGDPYMNSPLAKFGKKMEGSTASKMGKKNIDNFQKFKEKANAKKLEKKEQAKAKQLEKKENEWARTQPDALLKKYAADPTITKEALVKSQKLISKKKYVSDEEMGKIYTKAVVDAINKRLDAAPDNKSPSGDKRVRVEVVEAFGQTMLKPVVQSKVKKGD